MRARVPYVNRQPRLGFYKRRRSLFSPSLLRGPISDAITEVSEENVSMSTMRRGSASIKTNDSMGTKTRTPSLTSVRELATDQEGHEVGVIDIETDIDAVLQADKDSLNSEVSKKSSHSSIF